MDYIGKKRMESFTLYPAIKILQSYIGYGKVKKEKVDEAQKFINAAKLNSDEKEIFRTHINEVNALLKRLDTKENNASIREELSISTMNFKSALGMFTESRLVLLSAIMLRWLESVERIDQDVKEVIEGYCKTLEGILAVGQIDEKHQFAIVGEMKAACERYFAKHPELVLTAEIDNNKAFFINDAAKDKSKSDEVFCTRFTPEDQLIED